MRAMVMAVSATLVLAAPHLAVAQSAPTITKAEARGLPEPTVRRRVMDQLRDILVEDRVVRGRGPVRRLDALHYHTAPRTTAVSGLCRIDRLTVTFAPTTGARADQNAPVTANGFTSSSAFRFVIPPSANYWAIADRSGLSSGNDCAGTGDTTDDFFSADSEQVATDGYFLAQSAMDAVVAGNAPFEVSCDKTPAESQRTCGEIVGDMRGGAVWRVASCDTADHPAEICFEIGIGPDRSMRVVANRGRGPSGPPPYSIVSVQLDALVVIADQRID